MLIILEGPDCAGKSTLAQRLLTHLSVKDPRATVEVIHRGPPSGHPLDEYVRPLLSYVPDGSRHIICDRWHIGETIYPVVLGRPTKMTEAVFEYVKMFLRGKGALVVKLQPPVSVMAPWLEERGDDLLKEHQLVQAYAMFGNAARHVDLTLERGDVETIVNRAYRAERQAYGLTRFTTFLGDPFPQTLLVGDVRACLGGRDCQHRGMHPMNGPAFMPYDPSSGLYLMESLLGSVPLRSTGLANACDVDDVNALWWTLGCPHVVSLGQKAHNTLDRKGVPHAAVPHPQYVRRFHNRARTLYGQLIAGIVGTERKELAWRPTSSEPGTARRRTPASSSTY